MQPHPFYWSDGTHMGVVTSKRRLSLWYVNVGVVCTYWGFVLTRCINAYLSEDSSVTELIYMTFVAVYYSLAPLIQAQLLTNKEEFALFVNNGISFLKSIEDEHLLPNAEAPLLLRIVSYITSSMEYYIEINIILLVLSAFLRPESPEFLTSLANEPELVGVHWRLLSACCHLYITCILGSSSRLLLTAGFGIAFPGIEIIKELR
ncbi:unnamed protein product [Allacma fusca]|uniref:Uncharacterized protein n=1 Tax=Allacma fusca TaxID=39272 RepID=A0A8J2LL54_9HEXA|nr:unnamed protein product [Allacma fusca]